MPNADQTKTVQNEHLNSNKIAEDDVQRIQEMKSKMYGTPRSRSVYHPRKKRNQLLKDEHSSMRTKTTQRADQNMSKINVAKKQEEDSRSMDDFQLKRKIPMKASRRKHQMSVDDLE